MLWWIVDAVMAVVVIPTTFFFALRAVRRTMQLDKDAEQVVERAAGNAAPAAPRLRKKFEAGGSASMSVRLSPGRVGASAMAEHPELN